MKKIPLLKLKERLINAQHTDLFPLISIHTTIEAIQSVDPSFSFEKVDDDLSDAFILYVESDNILFMFEVRTLESQKTDSINLNVWSNVSLANYSQAKKLAKSILFHLGLNHINFWENTDLRLSHEHFFTNLETELKTLM